MKHYTVEEVLGPAFFPVVARVCQPSHLLCPAQDSSTLEMQCMLPERGHAERRAPSAQVP